MVTKTEYVFHKVGDDKNGFGGWRTYKKHVDSAGKCNTDQESQNIVHNWFWHFFDILLVIKISLAAAILWTLAYYRGEDASDGFPPPDPSHKKCTKSGGGQNFDESHATTPGKCGHKNSSEYYAHLVPPCLMVLVGMGLVYAIYPGTIAGTHDNSGLRLKAQTLYDNAGLLEGELTGDDVAVQAAQRKVTELKDASGSKGLEQLLGDLSTASGLSGVVASATLVLAKYNDVVGKYNAVKADTTATGKKPEFPAVESAFDELQTEFDKIIRIDKFYLIMIPSIVSQWLNFLTYVILLIVYLMGGDTGP